MLYSLARRIDQIVEVITFFADSAEDIRFTFYGIEVAVVDYLFQLVDKLSSLQIMQLLQLFGHTSP